MSHIYQTDSHLCHWHRKVPGSIAFADAKWAAQTLPADDIQLPEGIFVNLEADAEDLAFGGKKNDAKSELPLAHFLEEELANS